jgi:hypothetical protein
MGTPGCCARMNLEGLVWHPCEECHQTKYLNPFRRRQSRVTGDHVWLCAACSNTFFGPPLD